MGTVVSKAVNGVGAALGNAFVAPVRTIFGKSCEGVCSGTWDVICFIEHLCISNIVRLLMVLGLTFITLLFFYLLFKVGIIQCIARGFCKMCWAACEAYWSAIEGITCFLWYKLKNTKRVYHGRRGRRFHDMEQGFSASSTEQDSESLDGDYSNLWASRRKKRLVRERRRDHTRRSLHPVRQSSKRSHHHVRLKTREVSVHLKGSRRHQNLRMLQLRRRNIGVQNKIVVRKRRLV